MMQPTPQAAHKAQRNPAPPAARKISTEELAARLLVKEQTIRAGYCRDGHYFGLIPIKTPNRLLLWPADEVEALVAGQSVKVDPTKLVEHFARKRANAAKIPEHIKAKRIESAAVQAVITSEVAE